MSNFNDVMGAYEKLTALPKRLRSELIFHGGSVPYAVLGKSPAPARPNFSDIDISINESNFKMVRDELDDRFGGAINGISLSVVALSKQKCERLGWDDIIENHLVKLPSGDFEIDTKVLYGWEKPINDFIAVTKILGTDVNIYPHEFTHISKWRAICRDKWRIKKDWADIQFIGANLDELGFNVNKVGELNKHLPWDFIKVAKKIENGKVVKEMNQTEWREVFGK